MGTGRGRDGEGRGRDGAGQPRSTAACSADTAAPCKLRGRGSRESLEPGRARRLVQEAPAQTPGPPRTLGLSTVPGVTRSNPAERREDAHRGWVAVLPGVRGPFSVRKAIKMIC